MDDLLKPPDGSRIVSFLASLAGAMGGLKIMSVLANKIWDRKTALDGYSHTRQVSSEERAWKRVHEVEDQYRELDKAFDVLQYAKFEVERKYDLAQQRMESQIEQNQRLIERNKELEEINEDLERQIYNLVNQYRPPHQQ